MSNPPRPPYAIPFTCPRCHKTSHHPKDAEEGYCGGLLGCSWWTGDPTLSTPDGYPLGDTIEDHEETGATPGIIGA